jgi:hypothetical protein
MTSITELDLEHTATAAELAEAYDSYTDADEIYDAIKHNEAYAQAQPTTTVLTTSVHCGADE